MRGIGGRKMFEELYHLLSQLGLGAAARPICDLIADLIGESMSLQLLQQEILTVLHRHGGTNRADAVISAMVELGFAGLSRADTGAALLHIIMAKLHKSIITRLHKAQLFFKSSFTDKTA